MARNRVIYQSEALYVSNDITSVTTGNHRQLDRVQSANYNFSISRKDINQYGELAYIDSIVLEPPTVNLDFTYYLSDGTNERALGFYVLTGTYNSSSNPSGNFASGHMTSSSGKNFFIVTSAEGADHNTNTTTSGNFKSIIGIGNGFLSDYTLDAAVGSLPTVSVKIEAANITATGAGGTNAGISGHNPAIKPDTGDSYASTGILLPSGQTNLGNASITALRPGDVTISFGNISGDGSGVFADVASNSNGIHIQSCSLSIPLSRSPLQRLGTKFPFARTVDFPVVSTLTVNAILNEMTAENLATTLDQNKQTDITLTIKQPGTSTNAVVYTIKGARLSSESFSSSIGSNKTVDLTFTTQVGGPNDTGKGIFVSGIGSGTVFP